MRRFRGKRHLTTIMACSCLIINQQSMYTINAPKVFRTQIARLPSFGSDVSLQENSILRGHVLNVSGNPYAEHDVQILQNGRCVIESRADKKGMFAANLEQGDRYHTAVEQGAAVFRVWRPSTASRKTSVSVFVIDSGGRHRGQRSPSQELFVRPHTVAGVAASLIAAPILLHNSVSERDSSVAS